MRLLPMLALAGCWSTHTPEMQAAGALAARGDLEGADRGWSAAMTGEVTLEEWRRSRDALCAVREQRYAPVVAGLSVDSLTYDQAAALHRDLRGCAETGALDAEVVALEEAVAERALAEADALVAAGRLHEALTLAAEHVPHVRPGQPRWAWLEQTRAAHHAELAGLREGAPPVTAAVLAELMAGSGPRPSGPTPAQAAAAALAVRTDGVRVVPEGTCVGLLGAEPVTEAPAPGAGVPWTVEATLSECVGGTNQAVRTIDYEETRYRTEIQTVTRSRQSTVTTITPVTNVNCYTSLTAGGEVCTVVGSYNDYDTETTTVTWEEDVEVQVPYQVALQRQGLFASRSLTGRMTVAIGSPDGRREQVQPISAVREGNELPAGSGQDAVEGSRPSEATLAGALRSQALTEAARLGRAAAQALRIETLLAAATDRTDPAAAREALLTAWIGGHDLTEADRAWLAEGLAVPASVLAGSGTGWVAPDHTRITAVEVLPDLQPFQLPKISNNVRNGFPPLLVVIAASHHQGPALQSQPRRSSLGVALSWVGAVPLTIGPGARGVGLHLGPAATVNLERRLSKAYDYPAPLEFQDDERELGLAAGYQLSLGVLAGFRTRRIALFAGLMPQTAGLLIGDQHARGSAVPVGGRLELRFVERYPILIEGWGGDVRPRGGRSVGGVVHFPIDEDLWLSGRFEQLTLRTQVTGLHASDVVDAGQQPLRALSLGFGMGF